MTLAKGKKLINIQASTPAIYNNKRGIGELY